MKMPPVGGKETRYDHQKTGLLDDLEKLDDLIKFLDTVGPNARLRAKEENGVKFLHTRTGTPIGRFLKWMTIAWPEARRQRERVREFVDNTLKDIGGSDKYGNVANKIIKNYKDDILNTTLKVRSFEEFDIAALKSKLTELKNLADAAKASGVAFETAIPGARDASPVEKPTPASSPLLYHSAKQGPACEDSESASEHEPVFFRLDTEAPIPTDTALPQDSLTRASDNSITPVSIASIEMPVHEYADSEAPGTPMLAAQKMGVPVDGKLSESIRASAEPYVSLKPQKPPQSPRNLNPKAFAATRSDPAAVKTTASTPLKPEVTPEKTPEGKLEIESKSLAGSRFKLISLLEADAYLFPSEGNAKNPNEKLLAGPVPTSSAGLTAFLGSLADNASGRRWGMVVMDSPQASTTEAESNALYSQYLSAFDAALAMRIAEGKSVQSIAIRPSRKSPVLAEWEAQTLFRAINRIRESHPGINIRIVPSMLNESAKLEKAMNDVGKDSAPPFAASTS